MEEEKIRLNAIQRYLNGEKAKTIYSDLKRSKKWFFKWLKRYQSGQKDWYKDQSRAPRNSPNRILSEQRQQIINVRNRLESEPFSQVGVSAIKWELHKSGSDIPSDRTINRILKAEDLIKKNCLRSQRG